MPAVDVTGAGKACVLGRLHRHRRALAEGAVEQQRLLVDVASSCSVPLPRCSPAGSDRARAASGNDPLTSRSFFRADRSPPTWVSRPSPARPNALTPAAARDLLLMQAEPLLAGIATSIFSDGELQVVHHSTYCSTDLTWSRGIEGLLLADGGDGVAFVVVRRIDSVASAA